MTEYKVWAFARSAAPNLPALEDQLADVMREADRRGYIIVNSCMEQKYGTDFLQNHGAILITTKTNLQYELYLTGLENRLLNRTRQRKPVWICEDCKDGEC